MANIDVDRIKRFVLSVGFIPYVFFTLVGLAVLYVAGSILVHAIGNHGLIPPPSRLERYDCSTPKFNFSLFYLHGTDRVQIKSAQGMLEGTVRQNQFDWQGFGADRTQLGFAPPAELLFEDLRTLRVRGLDLDDVTCNNTADASGHQRTLSQ